MELKEVVRSDWLVAPGAIDPGVGLCGPGHLTAVQQGPERCSGVSIGVALKRCRPKDEPHGLVETVGAGARSVRWLLALAVVESLPSWAPPNSMQILSSPEPVLPIRRDAHCLLALAQINSRETSPSTAISATSIRTTTTAGRTSSRWLDAGRQRRQLRPLGNARVTATSHRQGCPDCMKVNRPVPKRNLTASGGSAR